MVIIKIENGRLCIRVGGGYLGFDSFVSIYCVGHLYKRFNIHRSEDKTRWAPNFQFV